MQLSALPAATASTGLHSPQEVGPRPQQDLGARSTHTGITFLMGQPQEGGIASCKLITDRALSLPHSTKLGKKGSRFQPWVSYCTHQQVGDCSTSPPPGKTQLVRPHAAYNSAFQNSAPIIRNHPSMDGENTSTTVPPVHSFSPLPATGHVLSSSW